MNRSLWLQSVSKKYCPPWPCSVSGKENVAMVSGSLTDHETAWSRAQIRGEWWDPDRMRFASTAWAECQNPKCMGMSTKQVQRIAKQLEQRGYLKRIRHVTHFGQTSNRYDMSASCRSSRSSRRGLRPRQPASA
jgi:hypothetical protein